MKASDAKRPKWKLHEIANYESGFDLTHVLGKGVNHEVFDYLNLFFLVL